MGAAIERSPLFSRMDITGIFDRLSGFPVYAAYRVLGGTVTMELIKIEQKPLDPELFVVPAGYSPGNVKLAGAANFPSAVRSCSAPSISRVAFGVRPSRKTLSAGERNYLIGPDAS